MSSFSNSLSLNVYFKVVLPFQLKLNSNNYLHQGDYVTVGICLSVCLSSVGRSVCWSVCLSLAGWLEPTMLCNLFLLLPIYCIYYSIGASHNMCEMTCLAKFFLTICRVHPANVYFMTPKLDNGSDKIWILFNNKYIFNYV